MDPHWNAEHIFHLLQFQLTLDPSAGSVQAWLKGEYTQQHLKHTLEHASSAFSRATGAEEVRQWLVTQVKVAGSIAQIELVWSLLYPMLMREPDELPQEAQLAALETQQGHIDRAELFAQDAAFSFMTGPPEDVPPLSAWSEENSLILGDRRGPKDELQWDLGKGGMDAWEGVLGGHGVAEEQPLPPTLSQLDSTNSTSDFQMDMPVSSPLFDSPAPEPFSATSSSLLDGAPLSLTKDTPVPTSKELTEASDITTGVNVEAADSTGFEPIDLLSSDFTPQPLRRMDSPLSTMTELPQARFDLLPDELAPPVVHPQEDISSAESIQQVEMDTSLASSKEALSLESPPVPEEYRSSFPASLSSSHESIPHGRSAEYSTDLPSPSSTELHDEFSTSGSQSEFELDAAFDAAFDWDSDASQAPSSLDPLPSLEPLSAQEVHSMLDSEASIASAAETPQPSFSDLDVVVGASLELPSSTGVSAPLMLNKHGSGSLDRSTERPIENSIYIKGQRSESDAVHSDRVPPYVEPEMRYVPMRLEETSNPVPLSDELLEALSPKKSSISSQFIRTGLTLLLVLVILGGIGFVVTRLL